MIIQVPQIKLTKLSSPVEQLDYAKEILKSEAQALQSVGERLDESFLAVVKALLSCEGRIGTGKSSDVGQKIAGTFCSTGARAYHFDSTKAMHGDLGMIASDDVVLILSHSGESEEIVRLLAPLQSMGVSIVALTGNPHSSLALHAAATLCYGPVEETCPLGLAPSSSTTVMMALGDALAFVLLRLRGFSREDFAKFHPAGSLGRKLLPVQSMMRQGNELRIANSRETVRNVFATVRQQGRRTGAVMLIDEQGKLVGLFTDSDLARLIENCQEGSLDSTISDVMTANPIQIEQGARIGDAAELMRKHRISELPVVDEQGKPVGLVDVTDLIGVVSEEELNAAA